MHVVGYFLPNETVGVELPSNHVNCWPSAPEWVQGLGSRSSAGSFTKAFPEVGQNIQFFHPHSANDSSIKGIYSYFFLIYSLFI